MTLKIRKLTDKDFTELYKLLKQAEFPYLPSCEKQAYNILAKPQNHLYGGFYNTELVLFMCFTENNGKLYFDIASSKEFRKKWASKSVIKFIFSTAFNSLKYDTFYTESITPKAQKAVETLGFIKLKGFYYKLCKKSQVAKKYLK